MAASARAAENEAYRQQELLRQSLKRITKAWYKLAFDVDLDKVLTKGSGTTFELKTDDAHPTGGGKYDENKDSGDIWITDNKGFSLFEEGGAAVFQGVLLHETGHYGADQPGKDARGANNTMNKGKKLQIEQIIDRKTRGMTSQINELNAQPEGYYLEYLQFGGIPSIP